MHESVSMQGTKREAGGGQQVQLLAKKKKLDEKKLPSGMEMALVAPTMNDEEKNGEQGEDIFDKFVAAADPMVLSALSPLLKTSPHFLAFCERGTAAGLPSFGCAGIGEDSTKFWNDFVADMKEHLADPRSIRELSMAEFFRSLYHLTPAESRFPFR